MNTQKIINLTASHDGLVITENKQLINGYRFYDNSQNMNPHRDAIALIPVSDWTRYSNATIENINIKDNLISGKKSMLQGITGFDGLFKNINCSFNQFALRSPHTIVFNGLLSGSFNFNKRIGNDTEMCIIRCNPWRIGGGIREDIRVPLIWVTGFKNQNLYQPIESKGTIQYVSDMRMSKQTLGHSLMDFDYEKFDQGQPCIEHYKSDSKYLTDLRMWALECGDLW